MVVRVLLNLGEGEMKPAFDGTPDSGVSRASSIKDGVIPNEPDGVDSTKEDSSTVDSISSIEVFYLHLKALNQLKKGTFTFFPNYFIYVFSRRVTEQN